MKNQLSSVDFSTQDWRDYISSVHESLSTFHAQVSLTQKQLTTLRNAQRMKQHSVVLANFEVGQFVLLAQVKKVFNAKLDAFWRGPYRVITAVSNWVYELEDLLTHATITAHASRLRFYADSSLNVDVTLLDQITYDRGDLTYEYFQSHRFDYDSNSWQLYAKWFGFDSVENTWEDAQSCYANSPALVRSYVKTISNAADKDALKKLLQFK
jgi:hypothetical protein